MKPRLHSAWTKARSRLSGGRLQLRAAGLYDVAWEPRDEPLPSFVHPISQACTFSQMQDPHYKEWCRRLVEPWHPHRKLWEWCYIGQACMEAGVLEPDRRGLGFGVGTEPLASYFASRGCTVVATDLPVDDARHEHWEVNNEHAESLTSLNQRKLCSEEQLRAQVSFRPVDMTAIPSDLLGFDFVWSSCAMEHLGSLEAGLDFVQHSLACLRPGGIAVHTTEYNVSSNRETITSGDTVAYRRRDIEDLATRLEVRGHHIACTFALGSAPEDRRVDTPPWGEPHLKIPLGPYVITSFGIVVMSGATGKGSGRSSAAA
jgi:hypothetical protein